jgi:Thioredoxin-like
MAKDTKRWLLVNLQRDSEFSCHALNRDVWRDELVENLIREGFVFWQSVRFLMDVVRCCLVLLTYIHLLLIL